MTDRNKGDRFAELLSRTVDPDGIEDRPLLMGIVNATPDSFSDGGLFLDTERAVGHARALLQNGADIIDVGGESTRPGAERVSEAEELRRVIPIIKTLAGDDQALISIDTVKPVVADRALSAGAAILNDVQGLQGDPALAGVAAQHGAGVVIMHNPGLTGSSAGTQGDPVAACLQFFDKSLQIAASAGVLRNRIVLDPGFGFGKTLEQNLALLARFSELSCLDLPLLAGTSRKSFIGKLLDREVGDRLAGTLTSNVIAAMAGAAILRVHDVAQHSDAMKMIAAVRAAGGNNG